MLQHANNSCTRTYAVGALARFNKSPTYRSCKALIRVLIYLRDTTERGIQFTGSDFELSAYSDADWGGDLDSRRSTTGYVVYAAGGPMHGNQNYNLYHGS